MTTQDLTHEHRLWTWHWKAALAHDVSEQLVLVRTSLGSPRWIPSGVTDEIAFIPQLAPYGLTKVEPFEEFERRYVKRLERIGVDVINTQFEQLREIHDGLPLALLCFEHHPSACHRGTFAKWWLDQTGEVVPEYSDSPPPPVRPKPPEPKASTQETLI